MMTLGDHVRLVRTFLEAFKTPRDNVPQAKVDYIRELDTVQSGLKVRSSMS
jgi:hypothetical protein